jgi:hypothetical protein
MMALAPRVITHPIIAILLGTLAVGTLDITDAPAFFDLRRGPRWDSVITNRQDGRISAPRANLPSWIKLS